MASAALSGLPNCCPESLLQEANWVLAGAGLPGGRGGEGEVDGRDEPVGGSPAAA